MSKSFIIALTFIIIHLMGCAGSSSARLTEKSEFKSESEDDSKNDPVRELLSDADEGEFYISQDQSTLTNSLSGLPLAGFTASPEVAKSLVAKVEKIVNDPRFQNQFRYEAYLTMSRLAGAPLPELTTIAQKALTSEAEKNQRATLTPGAYLELAYAAYRGRRYSLAHYYADRLATWKDRTAKAAGYNIKGLLASREGDTAQAMRLWQEAVQTKADYLPARLNLGISALLMGDYRLTQKMLSNLTAEPVVVTALIASFRLNGSSKIARALCQKFVTKKTDSAPAKLGCALNEAQGMKDYKAAKRLANEVAQVKKLPPTLEKRAHRLMEDIDGQQREKPRPKKTSPKGGKRSKKK